MRGGRGDRIDIYQVFSLTEIAANSYKFVDAALNSNHSLTLSSKLLLCWQGNWGSYWTHSKAHQFNVRIVDISRVYSRTH